jgi:hypothetical protein
MEGKEVGGIGKGYDRKRGSSAFPARLGLECEGVDGKVRLDMATSG